jgi:hypothetical protein
MFSLLNNNFTQFPNLFIYFIIYSNKVISHSVALILRICSLGFDKQISYVMMAIYFVSIEE